MKSFDQQSKAFRKKFLNKFILPKRKYKKTAEGISVFQNPSKRKRLTIPDKKK